jgi:hypothetical protein
MNTKRYKITYLNKYGEKEGYFVTGTKDEIAIETIMLLKKGCTEVKISEVK